MILDHAIKQVKTCAERMNTLYGGTVFNEWVFLSFLDGAQIVAYIGPRKEHFQSNFATDVEELQARLFSHRYGPGDFEFARFGDGTRFEGFMATGQRLYLICNNTGNSMEGITKDSRWLNAQVPFLELTEQFRKDPLVI